MANTWLTHKHSQYAQEQWETVRAHLQGRILDNLSDHLIQKGQGEADEAYKARKDIASYVPHYTRAVLALAGMIIQNEDDMQREWWDDETLGSPDTDGSAMSALWENVDGKGTDWKVRKTQALVDLTGYQHEWTLIEGVQREGEETTLANAVDNGRIRLINPLSVYDWITDRTGRMVQVKVRSEVDPRNSVMDDTDPVERFHVFDLEGVRQWREPKKEEEEPQPVGPKRPYGPNGFQYTGRDGRPILPIYRTVVPVRAPVGYMMAKFAEWLFNFRNVRNFHLWSSALARMWADLTDDNGRLDEDGLEKFNELIKEGSSFYPKELGYAAPPMDGANARNNTLEAETDNFYSVFFQSFGDVARERTATEINQQVAQSVGAYLTLETQAIDEWENDAMWRIAQVNAPNAGPELWGQATVERSTNFSHIDVQGQLQSLAENAFEDKVPLGTEGRINAAKKYADRLDIQVDEEQIRSEVESTGGRLLRRIREQSGDNGELQL